jgi:DnaK suppressor protein
MPCGKRRRAGNPPAIVSNQNPLLPPATEWSDELQQLTGTMKKLSKQQLSTLSEMLAEREKELREDIQRELNLQDDYAQLASEAPDPGDASFASLAVDLGNAAVSRDVTELRAIDAARARIESGTYGECRECGFDIPYERLEAQPTADRCAPCQGMREKTYADPVRGASL